MKIFGFDISRVKNEVITATQPVETVSDAPVANVSAALFIGEDSTFSSPWVPINYKRFNGEKTPGELGNPTVLIPDYRGLRIRAHEANFSNHIVRILTRRVFAWVVGSGLKLQAQPDQNVLKLEGIKENFKAFKNNAESYFSVYANSTNADAAGMQNLHELEADAYTAAYFGDCLVVLRVDENYDLKVQVIDGQHVVTPFLNAQLLNDIKNRGNICLHGIEMAPSGKHIAFYVIKQSITNPLGEFERIEAVGKESGCVMAWMIYKNKQRIDHKRGVPEIAAILQPAKNLDRYTEATVASAEERAKLPWTIEHDKYSDGENPVLANIKRNTGSQAGETQSSYELAAATAKNISATENKTVYNLPIGSKFNALNSTAEINYEPFFKAIFVQIAASMDIPPEIALQQYNSNYSASRAAINSWGYLINIARKKHGNDFKQKVYNVWLYIHILKNKISANGYLKALDEKNWIVTESYSAARWNGVNMPHIDPLKEANALRVMLGDLTTPLINYDQATEQLNNGDFEEMINQVKEERKIIPPPMAPPANAVATLKGDNVDDKPAAPSTDKPAKGKTGKKADK
jgi:capsid protein